MSVISQCPELSLEELYSFITAMNHDMPDFACRISFSGDHRRNVCRDVSRLEKMERDDGEGNFFLQYLIESSRRSLYDSLPEYMFHDVDMFSKINGSDAKTRFRDEWDRLKDQERDARSYLSVLDAVLFNMKLKVKDRLRSYSSSDTVLQNVLTGDFREECTDNEYVMKLIPFIPYSKYIRGNTALISILLRKLFGDDGLKVEHVVKTPDMLDVSPRYDTSLGGSLNETFLGTEFCEPVDVYRIHYWSDEECHGDFHRFLGKIEQFRNVLQDYFFSVEDTVEFEISSQETIPALSETDDYYLDYNTNI